MILVHYIEEPDGGMCVRVVTNEPGSYDAQLARLSLRAFVAANRRSYDAASRTWRVDAGGRAELGDWIDFDVRALSAHVSGVLLAEERGLYADAATPSPVDLDWPEFI